MTKVLTAQDILGCDDLKRELVAVPEWGGSVWVRAMTGTERSQYQEFLIGSDEGGDRKIRFENADVLLATLCMVGEDNRRLFTNDQVSALGQKSAAALTRVTQAATRLSAITKEDIEELVGNSDDLPSDGSTSS